MAIVPIVKVPDPVLKQVCASVERFDEALGILLDNMVDTMDDANGAGIAAPQIGVSLSACIVVDDEKDVCYELVNPRVCVASGQEYDVEGCLSIPEVFGYVTRPKHVTIKAQDRFGAFFELKASGYFARTILHEIDHLHGRLFTELVEEYTTVEELNEMQVKETRIVFMGTPMFSVPILERIIADGYDVVAVVTQPDRPVGRKKVLTPSPVKVAALAHGIPVLQPEKVREPAELAKLIAFEPDLLVTAAFGQILPKELLEYPAYGAINVHASLLPELRGGAPIHYAIMEGKKETGVTIMYMVERLDAGDMIASRKLPIEESDHTGSLHDKLSSIGVELLSETLPKILLDEIEPVAQDDSKATFARNIKRETEQVNFQQAGEEVYNHIRGLHPWPVAYTTYAGEVVKIWWGEKCATPNRAAKPGEIVAVLADGILVQTGNQTAIKLTDLQPAGKKRMKAEVLLRGNHSFIVGERFE